MTPRSQLLSTRGWLAADILALALAASCSRDEAPPPKPPPAIQLAAGDVAVVARDRIATGPWISGTLEARERAVVRAEVGGAVVSVEPEIGERVRRRSVIARINATGLDDAVRAAEAQVASARAAQTLAQQEAQRIERLVERGVLARREVDRARSNAASADAAVAQARAQTQAARAQLADAVVRAPITGTVARRDVNRGDIVTPGAVLFEIIDPSTMQLAASATAENLAAIAPGKPVEFTIRGYPDQRFTGTITRVSPAADPATRQIPILVDIPNPSGSLYAGLFAEGRVVTGERTTVVVPQTAIDWSGEQPSVTRIEDGRPHRVTIATGLRDERNELVEVTSGLEPGDVVIAAPIARGLGPDVRVQVPPQRTRERAPERTVEPG